MLVIVCFKHLPVLTVRLLWLHGALGFGLLGLIAARAYPRLLGGLGVGFEQRGLGFFLATHAVGRAHRGIARIS